MVAWPASPANPEPARSSYDGRRMTLSEFEALPEEKPYLQWWDGVVVQKAVPKRAHGRIQRLLLTLLDAYAREHGAEAWAEAHVWFEGHGYLVPDIAYWAPGKPEGDDERSLPPTLAVEIRSPSERQAGQREKCRQMHANGVDVCWLVDPASRTVELFEGAIEAEPLPADGALTSPLLPGLRIPLADIWAVLA
ncbi:MAG: Uma2 family endonuclease [Dehalococcoidia bacterium]